MPAGEAAVLVADNSMNHLLEILDGNDHRLLQEALIAGYVAILESALHDTPIRECTNNEIFRAVCFAYHDVHHDGLSDESDIINKYRGYADRYVQNKRLHAYTVDGKQCFLMWQPRSSTDGNRTYKENENYLAMAYVNPEARGTGVAERLLKRCMEESPKGLKLDTQSDNAAMIGLSRKLGFEIIPCGYYTVCVYHPPSKPK